MAAVVQPVFSIVSKRSDELGTSLQIWFASARSDFFSETAEFLDFPPSGMVRPLGFEPKTLCLEGSTQAKCCPNCLGKYQFS